MNTVSHLGIIPDGGRRWAEREGVALVSAYKKSLSRLGEYCSRFFGRGISSMSLYLLSKPNLKRNREELLALNEAGAFFLSEVLPRVIKEHNVGVKMVGRVEILPEELDFATIKLPQTKMIDSRLYLLVAYDPFDELMDGINALPVESSLNNAADILRSLGVPERVDLVIRSGGTKTISQFLPLQSSYARLVFRDELFNDLSYQDFEYIVSKFEAESLRFGT